jgi:hypothetical protein
MKTTETETETERRERGRERGGEESVQQYIETDVCWRGKGDPVTMTLCVSTRGTLVSVPWYLR